MHTIHMRSEDRQTDRHLIHSSLCMCISVSWVSPRTLSVSILPLTEKQFTVRTASSILKSRDTAGQLSPKHKTCLSLARYPLSVPLSFALVILLEKGRVRYALRMAFFPFPETVLEHTHELCIASSPAHLPIPSAIDGCLGSLTLLKVYLKITDQGLSGAEALSLWAPHPGLLLQFPQFYVCCWPQGTLR